MFTKAKAAELSLKTQRLQNNSMIKLKTIITDSEYKKALKEIETLMMAEANTTEG